MSRPRRGLVAGLLMGLLATLFFTQLLDHMGSPSLGRLFPFMAPGALLFGGFLGWTTGRFGRWRVVVALPLGVICAFANTVLATSINFAAGDPLALGVGHFEPANTLLPHAQTGLIAAMVMAVFLVPVGLCAGTIVTLATWRTRSHTH